MQRLLLMIFVLTMIGTIAVKCQDPDDKWWDILKTQGVACKNDTCRRNDKTCECYLTIEHRLTMMNEKEMILLVPSGGRFRPFNDLNKEYSQEEEEEFIAADGYGSRHESIRIVASDGFEIEPIEVESLIIHPGERIDFILKTDQVSGNYLLVAETLEVEPASLNQYHAAEAIIHYTDTTVNLNPPKGSPNSCSQQKKCKIFNCPYLYYPSDQNRTCLTWNDAKTIDPNSNIEEVKGVAIERFYNFAFPGENGNTPGSVNGHQFLPPTVAAYAEWDKVEQNCGECSESSICECTYYDTIDTDNTDQVYQFVLTNIGNGSGWSHPIHLHGHSFYVMKMGFVSYNPSTGKLIPDRGQDKQDIICNDGKNFCNNAQCRNSTWSNGNHPTLNWDNPPQKDTIIVPTGAYVVIRFKADNPGLWFFHCHIDLHNTNGMGMMINESPNYHQEVPKDFPRCKNYIVINGDGFDTVTPTFVFSLSLVVFVYTEMIV